MIERKAAELAEILTQQEAGALQDTLTFSIREIVRNVVEHSESDTVCVCAQYWPKKEQVEVGIVDDGIGIHAALTRRGYQTLASDLSAMAKRRELGFLFCDDQDRTRIFGGLALAVSALFARIEKEKPEPNEATGLIELSAPLFW